MGSAPITLVGRASFAWADSTTSKALSLTGLTGGVGSAPEEGDVVVFFYYHGCTTQAYTLTVSETGYATTYSSLVPGPGIAALAGIKVMGATPDTTLTVNTSNGFNGMARVVLVEVWRNVSATQPDVTVGSSTTTANNPDPPAITPDTDGAVILCAGGGGQYSAINPYTANDLTDFNQTTFDGPTVDVRAGVGHEVWTGGAFNAAQFGGGSAASCVAFSIALRPA